MSRLVLGFSRPLNHQGSRGNERGGRGEATHTRRGQLATGFSRPINCTARSPQDDIKEKRRLHVKDEKNRLYFQRQNTQRQTYTEADIDTCRDRHIQRQTQTEKMRTARGTFSTIQSEVHLLTITESTRQSEMDLFTATDCTGQSEMDPLTTTDSTVQSYTIIIQWTLPLQDQQVRARL